MSFKIPSLEEARKKKEASVSSPPPQFLAGRKRPATVAPGPNPTPAPTPRQIVNPYARASGTRPDNPYAKKTSTGSNNNVNSNRAASSSKSQSRPSSGGQARGSNSDNTSRWNRSTAEAYAIRTGGGARSAASTVRKPPPPPDADENPFATFSQTFGEVEDSEHFQKESEAIRGNAGSSRAEKARAEQRAFYATAVAAAGDDSLTAPNGMSARDQHIALQPHVLHVSNKQRGNAVLNFVRNVPFAYSTMVPDYIFSPNRCALFLSCKYHNLHPNYIHRRISELRTDFDLRVLLCLVDIEDNASTLLQLNKLCVVSNFTLILAWSNEEAARYLETLKAYEGKDASSIQRREQTNFADQVTDALCAIRSVNKTDSAQLMSQFGTLRGLMRAPMDELSLCPGIGEKKVRRLYEAFHKPFSSAAARKRRKEEKAANADADPKM